MSVQKITKTICRCTCELPGCKKTWDSEDAAPPERCRWCGRRTWNGVDKRKNVRLKANGKEQRLSAWARETGLTVQLIHHRLKAGWTEQDAVTIPAGKGQSHAKQKDHNV